MKILYLCSDMGVPVLGRKGASVHVRQMVAALSGAGHQVILAAPVLNKSPWETPEQVEAKLLHLKLSREMQAAIQGAKDFCSNLQVESSLAGELRRILYMSQLAEELCHRFSNTPPDFIYERAALFGTAGTALAKKIKVPLLLEFNAPLAAEQSAYRGSGLQELASRAEQTVLGRADAVLAVSNQLREHIVKLGVAPEKVHVVPNAVDPQLFCPGPQNPELRARYGLSQEPVIGFLGGLRPWHGIEVLPDLLEQVSKAGRPVRMIIAGDGPLRAVLETEFRKRALDSRVVFTGAIAHKEAAEVIRLFDVALAPYPKLDHEFYFSPLKLFEYMGCGVPVVAADLGQISELITHNKNGLLYPAGDLATLVKTCERLLMDPKLRLSLGQEAARLVHGRYTWDVNAARALALAKTLLARNPSMAAENRAQ